MAVEPDREALAGSRPPTGTVGAHGRLVRRVFRLAGAGVARYTRLDHYAAGPLPRPPALLVVNHGFGGLFDLNVLAFAHLTATLGLPDDVPATFLTHQTAWTFGAGPLIEPAGFRPADPAVARAALGRGEYVVVMPGGDIDAAKPWPERHRVRFAGRTGFGRLAVEAGVPVVPTVIVGAGESLLVLSDGQALARRLGLDRRFRNKTLPVTLSVPWGLSVGVVGLIPYLPLPTKLRAVTGPPMVADRGESAEAFAGRVHAWMQERAAELTAGRVPVVGWRVGGRPPDGSPPADAPPDDGRASGRPPVGT